jgi:hypothetical protein
MFPSTALQPTDLSGTVPCTAAVNTSVPPVVVEVDAGETVTDVTVGVGVGFGGGLVTVTVAEADLVGSATLVAVTESVPAFAGAV